MEQIVASPQYGKNLSKLLKTILILCMSIFVLYMLIYIAVLICKSIGLIDLELDVIVSLTMLNLIGVLGFIVSLIRLIKQHKFEKSLQLWEQDFVKVFANVSVNTTSKSLIQEYTFVVKFVYDGTSISVEKYAGNNFSGYDKILKEFIGKHVPIYFSNKYNEVVFIKDTN